MKKNNILNNLKIIEKNTKALQSKKFLYLIIKASEIIIKSLRNKNKILFFFINFPSHKVSEKIIVIFNK